DLRGGRARRRARRRGAGGARAARPRFRRRRGPDRPRPPWRRRRPASHARHAPRVVLGRGRGRGPHASPVTEHKIPVSALVVIHTVGLEVLLLERADRPGYWQSVTGSRREGETLRDTAIREVAEETGIDARAHEL